MTTIDSDTDPLLPHLLDIASDPASEKLILAGGFGMRLKQQFLRKRGETTLIPEVPAARATQDLDFFLRMELFIQKEQGLSVRDLLNRLSYTERTPLWIFGKATDSQTEVKVDLLARQPLEEEQVHVKDHRVGSGANIGLHGYQTPEAFAVEDSPLLLDIAGVRTDGTHVETRVFVPHPYAWLNMKIRASHDWLKMERGEKKKQPFREKHAFDVYVLVAMLLETELEEASRLANQYSQHPIAKQIKTEAADLYASPNAPGFLEAERQAGGRLDHELFWDGLQKVLDVN